MDHHMPTEDHFVYDTRYMPLFFTEPSHTNRAKFDEQCNSYVRYYYRMIRTRKEDITHDSIIGTSNMTGGELALYILRKNHTKRKSRYSTRGHTRLHSKNRN